MRCSAGHAANVCGCAPRRVARRPPEGMTPETPAAIVTEYEAGLKMRTIDERHEALPQTRHLPIGSHMYT